MDRRVAQGRSPLASDAPSSSLFVAIAIGAALVALALVVYPLSHPFRYYNHFEWQALAFLEGQTAIRYPVAATATSLGNDFFQDVLPVVSSDGVARGVVPFPPLPAVVLMPFVAIWGLAANGQLVFAIIGAIDVGLAWWVLGRLPVRTWVRVLTTLFLGFGTVLWYAAQIGTTWYQAHVLAVGLALAAIGVALGADRDAARSEDDLADEREAWDRDGSGAGAIAVARPIAGPAALAPDRRQFLAGLLFGLACTSRLTIAFAAPFFVLVGSAGRGNGAAGPRRSGPRSRSGCWWPTTSPRPATSSTPATSTSTSSRPASTPRSTTTSTGRSRISGTFPRMPRSCFSTRPSGTRSRCRPRSAVDARCASTRARPGGSSTGPVRSPFPKDTGMSLILTSPAYLLGLGAIRWGFGRSRLVTGAGLAVLIVALVNLMHFSQGWVQFGYRFSLDFAPWAVLLVAIGFERIAARTGGRPSSFGAVRSPAGSRGDRSRWPSSGSPSCWSSARSS